MAIQDNVMLAKKSCEDSSSESNPSYPAKTDCEINAQKKAIFQEKECLNILALLREKDCF